MTPAEAASPAALTFAFEALKAALLINGGGVTAAIALLAATKDFPARWLAAAALFFCAGVLCATIALAVRLLLSGGIR